MGASQERLLTRVLETGLHLRVRPWRAGVWSVPSNTDPTVRYRVTRLSLDGDEEGARDIYQCDCPAGQRGHPCTHAEAVRYAYEHPAPRPPGTPVRTNPGPRQVEL